MPKVEVVTQFVPVLGRHESVKKIEITEPVKVEVERDENDPETMLLYAMYFQMPNGWFNPHDRPEVVDAVVEFAEGGLRITGRTDYHGEGLPVIMFVPAKYLVAFLIERNGY